jgi:hypothetical protein
VNEPVDAVLEVEMLNVEDPEPLAEVGLKIPETPLGNPVTLRVTGPAKQLTAPTFTV